MKHVVQFQSIENLVEILEEMWKDPGKLNIISDAMRSENSNRLKYILRYWRRRLLDIAEFRVLDPKN